MGKAIVFVPSEEAIDRSLDARTYLDKLSTKLELEMHYYGEAVPDTEIGEDIDSVAVLAGLSSLELESGYMEMELDTIFKPQELLGELRKALRRDFPIVAVVDDAYSDYMMSSFIRAGASAVVGTSGDLFGAATSRIGSWDQLFPYINVFKL